MTSGKSLKLYNTLSRSKVDFVPLDPANVRMYVCGPTVYDFAHIGNARPAIVFDVLFRLLRHVYGEAHVTYVRNITDVDDKINARAARDYPGTPLNEAIRHVTEKTANQYDSDMKALGNLEPTFQPRATEFVQPRADGKSDMITLIRTLIDKDHAYLAGGEVLFDTVSMPDYGQLSKRPLDEQQAGARIAVEAHKKNPADFVLWKLSSEGEPGWDSPWGRGRPGWHIECSAMSEAYLGQTFDIHGGGLDLIFPHHENEIAQSRCAHGTQAMANVWMHNGFLQVEGQKMSKSLGNFFTIHQLLEATDFGGRKWPGEVLRLAMLMTHYREPIDFSVNRLLEAGATLSSWMRIARRFLPEEGHVSENLIAALSDDLNFSNAKTALDRLANLATSANGPEKLEVGNSFAASMLWLGLARNEDFDVARENRSEIREAVISAVDMQSHLESIGKSKAWLEQSTSARLAALAAKDFAEADRIRNELAAKGIQLMDYKDPETGERKTRWEIKR